MHSLSNDVKMVVKYALPSSLARLDKALLREHDSEIELTRKRGDGFQVTGPTGKVSSIE